MAGGVDDVDLDALILTGAVFGQDGDAALALDVAGVHHAVGHLLVGTERAGLLEHLVDQRGLAVVDVGDDGNVAKIFPNHSSLYSLFAVVSVLSSGRGAPDAHTVYIVRPGAHVVKIFKMFFA